MLSVKPERAVDGKKSKAIATKYDAADIAEMISLSLVPSKNRNRHKEENGR